MWRLSLLAAMAKTAASQATTLVASGQFCTNRGGVAGSNSMSVNVGLGNVNGCASATAANTECGNIFSYGIGDGWCDCIPCDITSCTQSGHASYNVYSIDISYQACPPMTSPSVALSPSTYVESTVPTQIVFSVTTTNALEAAETITITATSAVWSAATSVTCSVTAAGSPDGVTFASGTQALDSATFQATVQSGQSVAGAVSLVFTCTDNFAALASAGTLVTFTFQSSSDTDPVAGVTGWQTVATVATTLLASGKYCSNRGGSGGSTVMSVNVGLNNLPGCASAVSANTECSNFFSYGASDGWCDCVPCDGTTCTQLTHAVYNAYSIASSFQACPPMTATSADLMPSSAYEFTTPSAIVFSATTTNELQATGSITITATQPIWSTTAAVICSVTANGAPDSTTFASGTQATDTQTFVATVQSGQSVGGGVALVFTCSSNIAPLHASGTWVRFTFQSTRDTDPVTNQLGWRTVIEGFEAPLEANMPCSSVICPAGYEHRWDADSVLCAGACNVSDDLSACCVHVGFTSHSWRVQAVSNVSESWDLVSLRFYFAENCSASSLVSIAPGFQSRGYRGWPNGNAFSHHAGHGAVAQKLFAEPTIWPSSPSFDPQAVKWSSGGPCAPGQCFVGFSWESDVDRYPHGSCSAPKRGNCATSAQLSKAAALRVACAEVEQSQLSGRFAEILRLQLRDMEGRDDNLSNPGIWRTAAEVRGLSGGLATLTLPG
eukprot:TRINITY_DN76954_c0_g1_i1.p1 TRINITY_DN76954_c0_g1~~TRINITY_DN76954_c0_g1_i1.p1  ORF type:complete len:734 (-),score=98.33 TRINITY_DN76954_c0_g1_i1:18-2189(-)